MLRFILLLRGVNVSGTNIVKMADFRDFLTQLGFENVETYIQSGNAVLHSSETRDAIQELVSLAFPVRFSFSPKMMLITEAELSAAIAANPFTDLAIDPARLHAGFLAQEPGAEAVAALAGKGRESEEYQIAGRVFYLFTPVGMGKSKFAAQIERTLEVPVTLRNWRTILALRSMAQSKIE